MKKQIFYFLSLILIMVSCNSNDDGATPIDKFHENYYADNIKPALDNFKAQIERQIELTETFKTEASKANLNILQEHWLNCAESFSKVQAYNLIAVKSQFLDILIYNFPTNAVLVDNNIKEMAVYDSSYLSSKSTVEKGLGALEYLMFNNQDSELALTLLKKDEYRVNYALGVSKDILKQANILVDFWEQDYKNEFINARSVSCTENARCLAFNQLINVLDVIRVTKVGKPAGLENSSNTSLMSLEAYRSKNSLALIKSSIQEVEYAYSLSPSNFSSIVNNISGSSIISDKINETFKKVYANIDAIETSLSVAISDDKTKVESFHNDLFDLIKYFSVDAASILSVSVLPTDNDGD